MLDWAVVVDVVLSVVMVGDVVDTAEVVSNAVDDDELVIFGTVTYLAAVV